jgi:hypothetical protein
MMDENMSMSEIVIVGAQQLINHLNARIADLEAQNAEMQIKLDAANERAKMTMDALHVQYDQNAKLLALVRETSVMMESKPKQQRNHWFSNWQIADRTWLVQQKAVELLIELDAKGDAE